MNANLQFYGQKGAMFGLDTRVALAILGALALVVGISLSQTIPEIQARGLVRDIAAYKAAVEGMQYDLKQNISDVITSGGNADIKRFQALNDRNVIQSFAQPTWLGPYIRSRHADASIHENYGQIYLIVAERTDYAITGCSFCSYWLRIDGVPQTAFNVVNKEFDGAGETNAENTGLARYTANSLYVRLGNAL